MTCPQLLSQELRVLGVLMEKQLTTPDQYPLTLNSVITACNQKSSRDPVTNYGKGEVLRALQVLEEKLYVRKEQGSRSDKYAQLFMNHLELGRKQQALLCVMMLRGPQTISELHTRTQRMCNFTDKEDLEGTLERLCDRNTPYVERLSQQPGQRGERFAHLFSEPSNSTKIVSNTSSEPSMESVIEPEPSPAYMPETDATSKDTTDDNQQLTAKVEQLERTVESLKQQIEALYKLTGHPIGQ